MTVVVDIGPDPLFDPDPIGSEQLKVLDPTGSESTTLSVSTKLIFV
jgi:hypothetical protein